MARFIAGAVCPGCGAIDRIVIEEAEAGQRRRCVECGYTDERPEGVSTVPPARFSRRGDARNSRDAAPLEPLRIIDRPKPDK